MNKTFKHREYKTETRTVTNYGRRCEVTTLHFDTYDLGLRAVTRRWIDDADERNGGWPAGTVTLEIIRGDGRTDDFERVMPIVQIIEEQT